MKESELSESQKNLLAKMREVVEPLYEALRTQAKQIEWLKVENERLVTERGKAIQALGAAQERIEAGWRIVKLEKYPAGKDWDTFKITEELT